MQTVEAGRPATSDNGQRHAAGDGGVRGDAAQAALRCRARLVG